MTMVKQFLALLLLSAGTSVAHGQSVTYVHTDMLGSPVLETDANANVVRQVDYRAYGDEVMDAPQEGPGYTGHYRDAATGLVYAQQRYYDPVVGRFLSIDPVASSFTDGGNFNRFKYAANNPFRYVDPDGRVEDEPERQPRTLGAFINAPPPRVQAETPDDRLVIYFWNPVGRGRSSFGHVSASIGDTAYSFNSSGMWRGDRQEYLDTQAGFRGGYSRSIALTEGQVQAARRVLDNYGRNYNYLPINCTTPIQDALTAATGFGLTPGGRSVEQSVVPNHLDQQLIDNFDDIETNYYRGPKRE